MNIETYPQPISGQVDHLQWAQHARSTTSCQQQGINYKVTQSVAVSVVVINYVYFFAVALRPNAGQGLLTLEGSISHTTTRHSR
jgi:hypothetical protein